MNVGLRSLVLIALVAACREPAPPAPPPQSAAPPPPAPVVEVPKQKLTYGVAMPLGAAFEAERARATQEFLAEALDAEVSARLYSYDDLTKALVEGTVDIAFSSPLVYVRAANQAKLGLVRKALHGDKPNYRSVLFVRRDSKVATLADLKGRDIAFVRGGSASGNLYPRAYLLGEGVTPETYFAQVSSLSSHATVCDAVFSGEVQVGASFTNGDGDVSAMPLDGCLPSLKEKAADLQVIFASDPIPNDVVVVRSGFPEALAVKLGTALDALASSEDGQKILDEAFAAEGFVPVADADFASVRKVTRLIPGALP